VQSTSLFAQEKAYRMQFGFITSTVKQPHVSYLVPPVNFEEAYMCTNLYYNH